MRKIIAVALPLLSCTMVLANASMFAQESQSTQSQSDAAKAAADLNIQMIREDIRADRKQITAANMSLTPDEATKFWPVYDQYIQETIKINDARWTLMKDYSTNYDKMTDETAGNYMKQSAAIDQQLIALREKYVPAFEKIVSPKKTALWYQIDRRLDMLINLQLSGLVPLVEPTK
jgi:hypothetical protein